MTKTQRLLRLGGLVAAGVILVGVIAALMAIPNPSQSTPSMLYAALVTIAIFAVVALEGRD